MLITGRQPPTTADREKPARSVDEYQSSVRRWLVDVDDCVEQQRHILTATVVERNPTSIDADDARVELTFLSGN